ncbi:Delta(24)-sterol reductase [Orchesella cincta]|uniref:Delta(24)-sterol reductase n=1 Tax=Orchesella cincta TaxID=48709 RepID=A0A1D2NDB4_ORCCI|nr:Delta(24)-sterol reductase [Orchesella cincta]
MGFTSKIQKPIIRWLEDNRGLVVLFFCLPASFVFDLILRFKVWVQRSLSNVPETHQQRVAEIQKQVARWNKEDSRQRKLLCTSRPNWLSLSLTFFPKDNCHKVPINLYNILELDEKNLTVKVEPMVTVGEITKYLIPKGYTLAVTLEIADATLGGLAMGVGMTTYSHKVGLYQEAIRSYEVILGDGSLVTATRDNDLSDLYYALPWSHGSLGFLTALDLDIVPVKPYVHMRYIPVKGQKKYCDTIRELSGANDKDRELDDFIEATIYSKDEAVVMVGNFADAPPIVHWGKINNLARWFKPWFYCHVKTFLEKGESEEYIPLRQYLLRHNRSIFWVVEDMIPFGNEPWFRYLFGWLLPPKPAFLKFTTTPGIRAMTFTKQVFQDIVLPINKLEEQINISEKLFDTYPVLVYPCRVYDHGDHMGQLRKPRPDQMVPGANYGMFNDLGVYGVPGPVKRKEKYDAVKKMRAMEKFTRDVGGYPFLYADIFMTRQEFEEMFDLNLYEKVRRKYHAEGAFPHLFDKVRPEIDVFEVGKQYIDPL